MYAGMLGAIFSSLEEGKESQIWSYYNNKDSSLGLLPSVSVPVRTALDREHTSTKPQLISTSVMAQRSRTLSGVLSNLSRIWMLPTGAQPINSKPSTPRSSSLAKMLSPQRGSMDPRVAALRPQARHLLAAAKSSAIGLHSPSQVNSHGSAIGTTR